MGTARQVNCCTYRLHISMVQKKRVLYIAHGHPDFSYGGAEWAAYYMYQSMKDSDTYEPFFLARYDKTKHNGVAPDCCK